MSSAETTHPIEWRDDGAGGETAYQGERVFANIGPAFNQHGWTAAIRNHEADRPMWFGYVTVPTKSEAHEYVGRYARSFVEKSVKEAGHGE